jgi:hypothetical protein
MVNNSWKDCEQSFECMAWREFKGSKLMHAEWMKADGKKYGFGKLSGREK